MNPYRETYKPQLVVKMFYCPYRVHDYNEAGVKLYPEIHWSKVFEDQLNLCLSEGLSFISHSVSYNVSVCNPLDPRPEDQKLRYDGVAATIVFQK